MSTHCFEYPVRGHDIVLHCRVRIYSTLPYIRVGCKVKDPVRSLYGILPPIAKEIFLQEPDHVGIYVLCNRFPVSRAKGINHQDFITLCNQGINQV
jgi:hypothetical protein